jgi:Secretion system C-terminal sorting domain
MFRLFSNTVFTCSALLCCAFGAFAQINSNDPLSNVRHLISEDEVLLLWNETSPDGAVKKKYSSFYDFNPGGQNLTVTANVEEANPSAGLTGLGSADAASGHFFKENLYNYEGVVQAWRGTSGSNPKVFIELSAPAEIYNAGSSALKGTNLFGLKNMAAATAGFVPRVSVAAGNFWGDREDEFVVAFHASDGAVSLELYEPEMLCAGCTPDFNRTSTLQGPAFPTNSSPVKGAILDAAAGDVDADGYDELVIAYTDNSNQLAVNVYDFNAQGGFVLKTQKVIYGPNWTYSSIVLGLTVGDFNTAFAGDEIAVGARWGTKSGSGNPGDGDTRMYVARLSGQNLIADAANNANFFKTSGFNQTDATYALSMASGDVNGDLTDEIVMVVGPTVFVFKTTETGASPSVVVPSQLGSFSHNLFIQEQDGLYSNEFLSVGNVDNLNKPAGFGYDFRAEILIGKNKMFPDASSNKKQQSFSLHVFGFNNTPANPTLVNYNTPVLRNKIDNQHSINNENDIRRFAVLMGDFNGGSIQLGQPVITTLTDVLTPLVVINAPPTHFDIFGNKAFDINNLYAVGETPPGSGSDHFRAVYKQITNASTSFATTFTSDWAVSASVNAGFSASGFNVGAKMSQTYGEQFSKVNTGSNTITIVEQRSAQLDDELLAYTVDYTLYEYPVYNNLSTVPLTNLLVVSPGNLRKTFTSARSKTHRYPLKHQHGNLFSYPATPEDLGIEDATKVYNGLSRQEISKASSASSFFGITRTQVSETSVTKSNSTKTEVSAEAGGSFLGFSLGASVSGSYAASQVNTKTSNYQESVELAGFFGKGENATIDGDYNYFVQPIVYWSTDGSLVLDYLVDVKNIQFWQRYDKYDPAFLLPYQYESEKGFKPLFESERFQTRDILVAGTPVPGKTVSLRARVHNYGFKDTPAAPLEVCFFHTNPAGGAPVQIGCDAIGQAIRGRLNELDAEIAELDWPVPANLDPNTHIFAIIDRNNQYPAEVHDYPVSEGVSNNFGWTCLFNPNCTPPAMNVLFPKTTGVREVEFDRSWRVYPNPVKDVVILENSGAGNSDGQIVLYDLNGRLIKTWNLPAHTPLNRLQMQDQLPGVYFLKVSTEKGVFMEKIVKQ